MLDEVRHARWSETEVRYLCHVECLEGIKELCEERGSCGFEGAAKLKLIVVHQPDRRRRFACGRDLHTNARTCVEADGSHGKK